MSPGHILNKYQRTYCQRQLLQTQWVSHSLLFSFVYPLLLYSFQDFLTGMLRVIIEIR